MMRETEHFITKKKETKEKNFVTVNYRSVKLWRFVSFTKFFFYTS